jgi:YVTN family beta-propeller protein
MQRIRGHPIVVVVVVLLAALSATTYGAWAHVGHAPNPQGNGPGAPPVSTLGGSGGARGGAVFPASTGLTDSLAKGFGPNSNLRGAGPASSGWAVTSTLVIYNNTSIPGNYDDYTNGAQDPIVAETFDNLTGEVFALSYGDIVSVISDATNEVVHTFYPTPLGTPAGIAFDYKDNEVFILYYNYLATSYVAVVSATTTTVLATVAVQYSSEGIAYDSGLGEVFVSNAQSENVSVISTATNSVVATVSLPLGVPETMVYDSGQHEVFVINDQYDLYHTNVTVISDATNTVVATISVPYGAISLGYDPGKGEVLVGSDQYGAGGTCNVTVINDTTDSIVATIDVGIDPTGIAYVPSLNELYVTNHGSNNVSVISDVTNSVVTTVPLVSNPNAPLYLGPGLPVYDPGKAEVWFFGGIPGYVSSISTATHDVTSTVWLTFAARYFAYDSANQEEFLVDPDGYVAVVSDVTGHVVAEIEVGGGDYQVAYDSGKGEVWVTNNGGPGNITVINATTNTVIETFNISGVGPTGIAYDPALGEMFVGNENCAPCSNITVINDTTYHVVGVIPYSGFVPFDLAYDSGKGEIFAANIGGNVSVIDAATETVVASIGTDVYGGWGMAYDSAKGEIFLTNVNNNNVTVISDATNKVVANISSLAGAWGAAYDPAAGEVFIGGDEGSTVSVISDATNTIVDSITPDGEGPSSVAFDATTGDVYTADQGTGTFQTISPTGGTGPAHYPVTFHESGLPGGTPWTVTFNATLGSSQNSTIAYSVLNGDYSYTVGSVAGYTANVTGGPITVNGAGVNVFIGFSPSGVPTYAVTFDESGLPSDTSWTVSLEGTPLSSSTSSIHFEEVDGAYSFSVGAVSGYTAAPPSGMVTVSGAPVTKDIVFTSTASTPIKYPISFTETGLPSGTSWSVTLAGTLLSGTATLSTTDVNGSYPYSVTAVPGYTANPSSGTVTVAGAGQSVSITFTAMPAGTSPPSSQAGFLGLAGSEGYLLLGIILLAVVVVILFLAFARRPSYPIVFTETGLPPGTSWSIRLKGVAEFSETETIRFSRPSGTYPFEVVPSVGRAPSPATGYVVVEKEQKVIPIRFGGP